jgi:hypothetical protein
MKDFTKLQTLGGYEVFTQKNVIAQNQPMASLLSAIFADIKPAFSARMENDAQK